VRGKEDEADRDALTRAVRAGASIAVGSRLVGGLYQGCVGETGLVVVGFISLCC